MYEHSAFSIKKQAENNRDLFLKMNLENAAIARMTDEQILQTNKRQYELRVSEKTRVGAQNLIERGI